MDLIELSIFASRMQANCEEMGAVLRFAAFSTNIKDRLDFSCAIFDQSGDLCAQAAHIPVHLGSMAYAMRDIVNRISWAPQDMVIVNDPYLGGTHLPDVTLIAPVFVQDELIGYVANRAHHADIGADKPGSMPIARTLGEEGLIIPPTHLVRAGELDQTLMHRLVHNTADPAQVQGDFAAQIGANHTGVERLQTLYSAYGRERFAQGLQALHDYGERLARHSIERIPDGMYRFEDYMDDDGLGNQDIPIRACITVAKQQVSVDFAGTAPQSEGNINCPESVAAAAVYYVFRCLMPANTPACAGTFRPIDLQVPTGSVLNAQAPAAVAAGNVETSSRVVDVLLGALSSALPDQIPAASQGSMNNLAMGSEVQGRRWAYYETIAGGMGAGRYGGGLSAVQTHMTNTRNSPVEVLEQQYPVRVSRYQIRRGSGGAGARAGGAGVTREYLFLAPATVTLLTERRNHAPWGLAGGEAGERGRNLLNDVVLPPKICRQVQAGDRLTIHTPGGGGWGKPVVSNKHKGET